MCAELKSDEELDAQFKSGLENIEALFGTLKTIDEVRLCRGWLHKLHGTGGGQKALRNEYLTELIDQLKRGFLNDPFDKMPESNGSLPPFAADELTIYNRSNIDSSTSSSSAESVYSSLSTKQHSQIQPEVYNPERVTTKQHTTMDNRDFGTNSNSSTEQLSTVGDCNVNDDTETSAITDHFERKKSMLDTTHRLNVDINQITIQTVLTEHPRLGFMELQKLTHLNSEGGDVLISKDETEIKLKYVEKAVDELKGQVKIVVDNSNHNTDQMTFMTLELDKVKNDLKNISNQITAEDKAVVNNLSALQKMTMEMNRRMDEIISEGKGLKAMVADARENKKILKGMLALIKYTEEKHSARIVEDQNHFDAKLSTLKTEINQLTSYANVKKREVIELQQHNIDLKRGFEESIEKLEVFMRDKLLKLEARNKTITDSYKKMRKALITLTKILEECKASDPKQVNDIINDSLSALDSEYNECLDHGKKFETTNLEIEK